MAQIARAETNKTTNGAKAAKAAKAASDNVAEFAQRSTVKTAEVMREAAGQAENTIRDGLQTVRQAVDVAAEVERKTVRHAGAGMAEISQALMEAFNEQTQDNAQLFQALTKPANWGLATKLQREFLQASLMRTAQLAQRYVEVSQAVMTSVLTTGWGQAKKVA